MRKRAAEELEDLDDITARVDFHQEIHRLQAPDSDTLDGTQESTYIKVCRKNWQAMEILLKWCDGYRGFVKIHLTVHLKKCATYRTKICLGKKEVTPPGVVVRAYSDTGGLHILWLPIQPLRAPGVGGQNGGQNGHTLTCIKAEVAREPGKGSIYKALDVT